MAGGASRLSDDDLYLFNEGRHRSLYLKVGAHPRVVKGQSGYSFAVWAPNAERVSVIGDFNSWSAEAHPLSALGTSGLWEGFIAGAERGQRYKYRIVSRYPAAGGYTIDKADPLAFFAETAPNTASILWDLDYAWGDQAWMRSRGKHNALDAPMSIYELHLGSWQRAAQPGGTLRMLSYRELAPRLADYVAALGFTHVELLPVMEHPFYGSWGYQVTGFFAATSRYGAPQDLMFLIDALHQRGIGVILDWVPSHFPDDPHGLGFFDGTHLYEHQDQRQGLHPEWNSLLFNYSRNEVRSFLLSSAHFWLERYHADGLRVDAVASMLYLDYSRRPGEWVPNAHGGRENLAAIHFLRDLNADIYRDFPDVQIIAEESTSWPQVTRPTEVGGLGFGLKWDMGWMHDTLKYLRLDPVHRRYHHADLTFRMMYAYAENFVLALSHDEVVHMKGSLYGKLYGDDWQKRAGLRLLFGYLWTQPGKKLLFMGGELAQLSEWNHESSLDWHLLENPDHRGVQRFVAELNRIYLTEPALWSLDYDPAGFRWLDADDAENSVYSFLRRADPKDDAETLLIVCNFTPVPRENYRLGVPHTGRWREILNSDASDYGGSGLGNLGEVLAEAVPRHGQPASLAALLPPLSIVIFKAD